MKSWISTKISDIDKPLVELTKKQNEKTYITKIRNERGGITTDSLDSIRNVVRLTGFSQGDVTME